MPMNIAVVDLRFSLWDVHKKKISKRFKGKVTPVVQDVVMPLTLDVVFDYIIHAASNADPKMYALQPAETILTNVIGTKMCLNTVRKT